MDLQTCRRRTRLRIPTPRGKKDNRDKHKTEWVLGRSETSGDKSEGDLPRILGGEKSSPLVQCFSKESTGFLSRNSVSLLYFKSPSFSPVSLREFLCPRSSHPRPVFHFHVRHSFATENRGVSDCRRRLV